MLEFFVGQQFVVFSALFLLGLAASLVFDILSVLGKGLAFSRKIIFLLDLAFCIFFACLIFQTLYLLNWGEVRFYVFLALFVGIVFYYFFCSRFVSWGLKLFLVKLLEVRQELGKKRRSIFSVHHVCYANLKKLLGRFFRKGA